MSEFNSVTPFQLKEKLQHLSFPWWICGGWGLELYAGHKIREHHDIDIAILRKDHIKLREELPGWEFKIAVNKVLHDWGYGEMPKDQHALWAKRKTDDKWLCEFLLNESDEKNWIFRKNETITLPLSQLTFNISDLPVLNPLIPLLFKSAHGEEKDEMDFKAILPKLNKNDRAVLKKWITQFKTDCDWLNKL